MTAERLNRLASIVQAKSYLEIGVCEGSTFFDVQVSAKTAVDPDFRFDWRSRDQAAERFYEVPSDTFFSIHSQNKFDLIYLDGLHTYEQTLRDFLNSLAVAHEGTLWLIDDTVPNNNLSALPSMERCYRLRQTIGDPDWAWMGDVYKVVFFIHSMMKDFDLRTFRGRGQTVVWKRSRKKHIERSGLPLPTISALTYEDFLEHSNLLCYESDEEIYNAVIASRIDG